jgi:hypothetical protein
MVALLQLALQVLQSGGSTTATLRVSLRGSRLLLQHRHLTSRLLHLLLLCPLPLTGGPQLWLLLAASNRPSGQAPLIAALRCTCIHLASLDHALDSSRWLPGDSGCQGRNLLFALLQLHLQLCALKFQPVNLC